MAHQCLILAFKGGSWWTEKMSHVCSPARSWETLLRNFLWTLPRSGSTSVSRIMNIVLLFISRSRYCLRESLMSALLQRTLACVWRGLFLADGRRSAYTWGGASSFILTQESLRRLENGLPLEEFPATIRDAIVVTKALGIQYLWVDSLCIFQDSPEDWSREAPKMDDIYNHEEVVIAATASDNVNSRLFKIRSQIHSCRLPWKTPKEYDGDCTQQYVGVQPYFDYFGDHLDIQNCQWVTRGWTMQEDLLASRLLSYTRGQIGWECPSALITESGGDDRSTRNRPSARQGASTRFKRIATHVLAGDVRKLISETIHSTTNVCSTWYSLLRYYSRRNFTVASDRLAALASFASRMQVMLEDEYCAGLWKGDLIRGLLWNHGRHHGVGYPSADDNGGLRGGDIGPSWS